MAIDPKIKEAIVASVIDSGQPEGLARKLVSWFESIATGQEKIDDRQSADRHLELLYREVCVASQTTDEEFDEVVATLSDAENTSR